MKIFLNLLLLLILALTVWSGFKRGIIQAISSLLAIVIALIIANVIATTYAKEVVPALNPFIGGYVDSETTNSAVLEKLGYGDSDKSLEDILAEDTSLRYDYAYEALNELGFYKEISEDLADDAVAFADRNNIRMTDAVITIACNTVAYVGIITVSFIMILILLNALLDIINLDFRLPNAEVLDEAGGSAIGLIKGFLYCVLICWVLGFAGAVIGKETADRTALVRFFLAFRFITRSLI